LKTELRTFPPVFACYVRGKGSFVYLLNRSAVSIENKVEDFFCLYQVQFPLFHQFIKLREAFRAQWTEIQIKRNSEYGFGETICTKNKVFIQAYQRSKAKLDSFKSWMTRVWRTLVALFPLSIGKNSITDSK